MRLHEQLGGPEPDYEVDALRAAWRQAEGVDERDPALRCPDCDMLTSDGSVCSECLSERASYYIPDEGGQA